MNYMKDKWFFEIPIYRYSMNKFEKECEKSIMKHHVWLYKTSGVPKAQASRTYHIAEERIRSEYGPWRYNQIVGWIRLLALTHQIQAEYYFVEEKRITKNVGKKKKLWQGKAFESHFFSDQTSENIFYILCDELKKLSKIKPFQGRFIDLELFINIGPYINWRKLTQIE